jgi:hypothetical protein
MTWKSSQPSWGIGSMPTHLVRHQSALETIERVFQSVQAKTFEGRLNVDVLLKVVERRLEQLGVSGGFRISSNISTQRPTRTHPSPV